MGKVTKLKSNRGFTMVEVLLVIALISIVSIIALPRLMGFVDIARESVDESNAAAIFRDVQMAYMIGNISNDSGAVRDISDQLEDIDIDLPDAMSSNQNFVVTSERISQNPSVYIIEVLLDGQVLATGQAEAIE